jgi:hypothetical protein
MKDTPDMFRDIHILKIVFTIMFAGFAGLSVNCLNPFAPKLEESPGLEFLITDQANPEEVLQNFKLAYLFRDSVLYSDVIDSSFTFYYWDTNIDASGIQGHWGRDTDLKTTGRLFRIFDMINLNWESSVYTDTLDWNPAQEPVKIEIIERFALKLGQSTEGLDYDIWGKALFTFKKNPFDNKWRISHWKDESFY